MSVKIPAGVDSGVHVRLASEGEAGQRGGPPGNLFVVLEVKPHPYFQRQENNIILETPHQRGPRHVGREGQGADAGR